MKRNRKKSKAKTTPKPSGHPRPRSWGTTWLPDPGWGTLFDAHADYLTELHDLVQRHVEARERDIQVRFDKMGSMKLTPDEEYEYSDFLVDELHGARTIERWSKALQAVALYHQVEAELSMLFGWILSGHPKPERQKLLQKVHRWSDLRSLFQDTCADELTKVASYNDVDELRNLCNSVKHSGLRVNEKLAQRTKNTLKLTAGQPIDAAQIDLDRYRTAAKLFVDDFACRAEKGLQRKFGSPAT